MSGHELRVAITTMTERMVELVFAAVNYAWMRICMEKVLLNPDHEQEGAKLAVIGAETLDLRRLCDEVIAELTANLGDPPGMPTCAEVVRAVEEHLRAQVDEKLR